MKLFRRYKERFEEFRRDDLTPEARQAEDFATASNRVTLAVTKLKELDLEFLQMKRQYAIEIVMPGRLKIGKGSFDDIFIVNRWWNNFKVRRDEAQAEFNSALSVAAGLKPDPSRKEQNNVSGYC